MKILHVGDQAGVACILAKYQRKLGHFSEVIMRDGYDGVSIHKFYGTRIVTPKTPKVNVPVVGNIVRYSLRTLMVFVFYLYVSVYSRKFDVVHIHSCWIASFFTFKPKVVEFHGDEIRGSPSKRWFIDTLLTSFFVQHWKNKVKFLVSTPDLLGDLPEAEWLPNPVDTEHFSRFPRSPFNNWALYFYNWHEKGVERANSLSKEHKLFLCVVDRTLKQIVDYKYMPSHIIQFEYLIDRAGICSLSKTALEMLASGGCVFDWKDRLITAFPEEHDPFKVAEKSVEIYQGEIAK
jgi:hypothetical protein